MHLTKSHPSLSQHPLMGVDIKTLYQILKQYGGVSGYSYGHLAAILGSAIGRMPFRWLERWKVRGMDPAEELEAPLFIVGYWRSGTTHLHNLLGQSPLFGIITPVASGLPAELLTLASWLEPLLEKGLPEDRGIDQVAVTPQSPQEDEIPLANMQPLSVFHALYFGKNFKENFNKGVFFEGVDQTDIAAWRKAVRYLYGKVARHQNRQPLLIKNPIYTARVDMLLEMWPDARFIHIYRNPYTVYHSTVNYYYNMLDKLSLQRYNAEEIETVVQKSYTKMLDKLYSDTESLSSNQFVEVKYEELDRKPLKVLEKVYGELAIPGWKVAKSRTLNYLDSIADYTKNPHDYSADLKAKVDQHWGKYVKKWGYQFPEE